MSSLTKQNQKEHIMNDQKKTIENELNKIIKTQQEELLEIKKKYNGLLNDNKNLKKEIEELNDKIYHMHLGVHDTSKTYFNTSYFNNY